MGKVLRRLGRLAFVAIAVGLVIGLLRRLGLLGSGDCSASCGCSTGVMACLCGHKTCLAPTSEG